MDRLPLFLGRRGSIIKPKVSVIMLTYNREQYVSRAIESILNQTFVDFELILVDNGSKDNSGVICDNYATRDTRISVIHKEKGNIGSGRNAGLLKARGEYITFIDDDDTAEPDMLAFLYDLITRHEADISICGSWRSIDGVLTPKYNFDEILELDTEQAVVELLKREHYNIGMPTKMFYRTLLIPPPFLEQGNYDDITTTYKVFSCAQKVIVHGVPKYTAYRHEKNNSAFSLNYQLIKPNILDEYLRAYRERTEYLSEKLPAIKDYVQYSEWSFMISIVEKIKRFEINECKQQYNKMYSELTRYREEFLSTKWILDFEKGWVNQFI